MSRFRYLKSLIAQHMSLKKGIAIGLLFSLSDAVCQLVIEKQKFDWKRNQEFLTLGLFWLGPVLEVWYSALLPQITNKYLSHMKKPKMILCRMLIDTFIFSPLSYGGFYIVRCILFGQKPLREIDYQEEVRQKYFPTLLLDWVLWTPANLINFWWVPVRFQSIYAGMFTFIFNIGLAFISNKELLYEAEVLKEEKQAAQKGTEPVHQKESLGQLVIMKIHPSKKDVIL